MLRLKNLRAILDQEKFGRTYISMFAGLCFELANYVLLKLGINPIKTSNDLNTIVQERRWPMNTLQFSSDAIIWRWESFALIQTLKVIISNFFSKMTGLSF